MVSYTIFIPRLFLSDEPDLCSPREDYLPVYFTQVMIHYMIAPITLLILRNADIVKLRISRSQLVRSSTARDNNVSKVTKVAMAISTANVLFLLPSVAGIVHDQLTEEAPFPDDPGKYALWDNVRYALLMCNHAGNFLYLLASSKFRVALRKWTMVNCGKTLMGETPAQSMTSVATVMA
jgi:hypothetical protein